MKLKKKIIILCSIAVVLLVGAIMADKIMNKNYYNEIKSQELIEKIEAKESFVVCISQTTCGHCASYKPKLEKVANKYHIETYYIDVDLLSEDEQQSLNKYINISGGTPSTVFIKNGEEKTLASRINGDVSMDKIVKKMKQHGFIEK